MATNIYRVQTGDNLTKIAKAHNTTVQELARLNHISNPNRILAGMEIKLCEEQQPAQQSQQSYEELQGQLTETQNQLTKMQNQMNDQATQGETFDTGDMLGVGLGAYGAYKLGEKALPYVWKGTKNIGQDLYLRGLYAKDGIKNGAKNVANKVGSKAKHLAKKAELEYAFGKDAVKQGAKKVTDTATKAGKSIGKGASKVGKATTSATKSVVNAGKIAGRTAMKALSRAAVPLMVVDVAVETYDAYKEGGIKKAAKTAGKHAGCIAAGAAIGSIIPGVGTLAGAAIGSIVACFI